MAQVAQALSALAASQALPDGDGLGRVAKGYQGLCQLLGCDVTRF